MMERKLSFILAMDVVDYSLQTGVDEDNALSQLHQLRQIVDPVLRKHKGRIFNSAGDSILVEFHDPLSAIRCAVEFQELLAEKRTNENGDFLQLRVGINLGYVTVEGEDLLGEGVNVAARLESFCLPGGIAISGNVYDLIHNKTDYQFDEIGLQIIKNTKVHVFDVVFREDQPRRISDRKNRNVVFMVVAPAIVLSVGALLFLYQDSFNTRDTSHQQRTPGSQKQTAQPHISLGFLQLQNKSGFANYDNTSQEVSEHILQNFGDSDALRIDAYFKKSSLADVIEDHRNSKLDNQLGYLVHGYLTERADDYRIDIQIYDLLNRHDMGKFSLYTTLDDIENRPDQFVTTVRNRISGILKRTSRQGQIMTMDGQFIDLKRN